MTTNKYNHVWTVIFKSSPQTLKEKETQKEVQDRTREKQLVKKIK